MAVMDRFRLDGQCAIITGAAQGLGKAMAQAIAEAGARIVIADKNGELGEFTAQDMRNAGAHVVSIRTDVTKPGEVAELVQRVMTDFGRIDVLVNNAGIVKHEKAEEMSFANWREVLDTNLNGVFLMSQAVGKEMIRQKKGSIINISSMSGIIVNTPQEQCSYNVSKAGVIMLTKSLAAEWAPHNVRVNTIAPGYMKTALTQAFFDTPNEATTRWMGMTPMGRPGTPDELGGIAVYLASDASSFATGGVFTIDGGYTAW